MYVCSYVALACCYSLFVSDVCLCICSICASSVYIIYEEKNKNRKYGKRKILIQALTYIRSVVLALRSYAGLG